MILYPDVQKQGKPVNLEGIWPPKSERERIFNIINGERPQSPTWSSPRRI